MKPARAQHTIEWFDLKLAQDKGSIFWQTHSHATVLCESMLADCMVEVMRRNQDNTEAEIRYQKGDA